MNQLVPFHFENTDIRVVTDDNGEPLFVGKDICEALGYADPTTAIKSHCRGVQKLHPIVDSLGRKQNVRVLTEADMFRLIVNSTLPSAEAFECMVFEEILPTIRKTGSYTATDLKQPDASKAFKLVPIAVRAARALGLDKNAAAISANQAVAKLTGTNVLQLLDHTHLEAERQDTQWFTPTELGQRIGCSARGFNLLLAEAGLQMKRGDVWEVTDAGKEFARLYDTGKKHGSGVVITQIKWSQNVLPLLGAEKEAAT